MNLKTLMNEINTASPVSLAVASLVLLVATLYLVLQWWNRAPGPIGLPYLGYWPFLSYNTCHLKLDALKKKYGDVFLFTVTGRQYVHLGSTAAVREAHVTKSDCFTDRAMSYSLFLDMFRYGVLFENGEAWKVQRKFFIQAMKERSVKAIADSLSGPFYDVINSTIQEIKNIKGEPINITEIITRKCTSTFRLTLFGDSLTDAKVTEITIEYEKMVAAMTPTNLLLIGYFAKYFIFPFQSVFRRSEKSRQKLCRLIYEIINEHKKTYEEDHIRDVIDDYIKERNSRQAKGDPTAVYFTDDALMGSLVQIMGDGVMAPAYQICIMIQRLIKHPEEQDKIYREIVDVVGEDRLPTLDDKPKLPYTNAFMLEVFRTSEFFPLFPALECTKETTLRGCNIPKGAITLLNMWSCHNDPETYEEPDKFNPSRFISKDGKNQVDRPLTFGSGKRTCVGEGFSMAEIFLFLTAIVKNFHLTLPKQQDSAAIFDMLLSENLQVLAEPRKEK